MAHDPPTMASLDDPLRLDPLGLHLTSVTHDEILDSIVRKVAKKAGTSIALVSLVMGRIQFFRASVGLPTDLEKSRATSRCYSFCQLVVKAETEIIIADATTDPRVPKDLVDLYDAKAYVGVPIHHEGMVIGSLCALDSQPRRWPSSLPRELKAIAKELEARLDTLRERNDEEEVVVVSDLTLNLMMAALLEDARALEKPLLRLSELLRSEKWRELAPVGSDGTKPENISEIAHIYRTTEESIMGIRRNVLRMADGFELRKGRVDTKVLASLRQDARTVARAFGEMGPMVRLVEALAAGVISEEDFAKNAGVLKEAYASADDALESLRRLAATGQQLIQMTGSRT